MDTNRRSSRRFALSLPVEACGESPFKTQPIKGRTRNVSANGIYFVCDEACMAGQLLYITMKLPGDKLDHADGIFLRVRCRVRRVEEMLQNGSKAFGIAVALDE